MPLPPSLVKQELHFAYFRAVVADAGATAATPTPDIGIDFIVSGARIRNETKYAPTGLSFFCQLKSTIDWTIRGDDVVYAVEADAYNKLAELEKGLGILIVYALPQHGISPLTVDESCLQLRKCCYWYHIPREPTLNTSSITIKIPRTQLFDRNAVARLLELDRMDAYRNEEAE
ncbi:MAG: DUF4365 domain-containing protein [Chloroflexota bacterium]|nr:DUF4365 domain-containing protein [Chloroflexota bacterium]MDE2952809.1 DUF4365 domain-containing protein [Chloroflexota bacterium]